MLIERQKVGNLAQDDLATRWRMSPRTLEQWRWRGVGPRYLKIGGRVIYPETEVEAHEAAQLRQNTAGPLPVGEAPDLSRSPAASDRRDASGRRRAHGKG